VVLAYAPQAVLPMEEKVVFYSVLRKFESDMRSDEKLILCEDLNGHVGAEAFGSEEVHGGHWFRNRNLEGKMLLEFAETMEFIVTNTWFQKGDRQKVTHESGAHGNRTVIDFGDVKGNRTVIGSEM
jgi:hypothetical protein